VDFLILAAALILGLCIGLLWMARAWARVRPQGVSIDGRLVVAGSVDLGKRCSLYLIQAEGRAILAGIDRNGLMGLMPLVELPDQAGPKSARLESESAATESEGQMIVPISKHRSE
jgi:flagellar biogenesis protein FliO